VAAVRFTHWLLGLAGLTLIFLISHLHPLAFLALGTWLPLPILLVGWRCGEGPTIALAATAALLIFATQPTLKGVLNNLAFGQLLLLGAILNGFRARGFPAARVLVLAVGTLTLLAGLFLVGQALLSGLSLLEVFHHKAGETAATLKKMFSETGADPGSLAPPGLPLDWETLVRRVFPALFVINTAMVAWLNLAAARLIARSRHWGGLGPPLYEWSNPEWLIFFFLGAGFLALVPLQGLRLICLNLLLVLSFLYFCQGVAVVAALFQRYNAPGALRLLGYALLFMNPLFFLVIILGLMDLWLDFRRLHQPKNA